MDATIDKRLEYFASLEKGWFDVNIGKVISADAIEAARKLLIDLSPYFPVPHLIPCEDGHISIEWLDEIIHPLSIDVYDTHYDCIVCVDGSVYDAEFSLDQIEEARLWCLQFHPTEP